MSGLTPHPIAVAQAELDDLSERLGRNRWPEREAVDDWSQGIPLAYVQELCAHWAAAYDWRRVEAELNRFEQLRFTPDVGAPDRSASRSSTRRRPTPAPCRSCSPTAGRVGRRVPRRHRAAARPGRRRRRRGRCVPRRVPDDAGLRLQRQAERTGWGVERIAEAWVELMVALGYDSFGAQGGDWGSAITTALGAHHGDHVVGIHLNMVSAGPGKDPGELTEAEQRALARLEDHRKWGMGYSTQQSTRPQTLGYGLVDSPAARPRGSSRSSGRGPTTTAIPRTPCPATGCSTT